MPASRTDPDQPATSSEEEPPLRPDTVALIEAVGGPLGIAEATLPFIAFTVAWTAAGRDVVFGAIVAVAITVVLTGLRIWRSETTQFALSGLIGVGLGAFVAARTGEASNFFLPGILTNAGWLLAHLVSIVIRRPLIGFVISRLTGEGSAWHEDPAHLRRYVLATWIWVGLFALRLGIQLPLFLSDSVAPLAVARVITGAPLFALGLWLNYLVLRPIIDAAGGLRLPKPPGG